MTADIADFADKSEAVVEVPDYPPASEAAPTGLAVSNSSEPAIGIPALTQWTTVGPNMYAGVSSTIKALHPGVYTMMRDSRGQLVFICVDTKVDDLMDFPDSTHDRILREIDDFWSRSDKFKEFGFLHRRGFLFYGPAGSGKTSIVNQIMSRIVKSGGVVFLCSSPQNMTDGLAIFRQIEPKRRAVCVFEDIDAIINDHGEDRLLSLLDGENQVDCVLNIATTNYPERLDKRMVARPRRFDRVEKIGMPNADVRRVYLSAKLKASGDCDVIRDWVGRTEGLSFAALAELVISVKCLGNTLEDTLKILRSLSDGKASSAEFETKKMGLHA